MTLPCSAPRSSTRNVGPADFDRSISLRALSRSPRPGLAACAAALSLVALASGRAPAESCDRSCSPGQPRDGRGCCIAPSGPVPPASRAKASGTWVLVRAGAYDMGTPPGEAPRDADEALRRVTLTGDVLALDSEVTQSDFQRLLGYNPSHFQSCGPDCPVENVSWHEAAAYCNALSDVEGLARCYDCAGAGAAVACLPSTSFIKPYACPGYRLPTEAEWEHMARAGTATATYAGDLDPSRLSCEQPNLVLDEIAWFCGNSGGQPRPVRTRRANAWGLFDMLGNVYEWCHDWYDAYPSGARTDPWGAESGSERVVRGGSWCCTHNRDVRAGERMSEPPGERHSAMGFRPVRAAPRP